jgi:hypothetical protein
VSGLEDRLREAYLAAAELVREDAVPAGAPTRRADSRRRAASASGAKNTSARHARWTVPVATAATVAVIAVTGGVVVPHVLSGQHARARAHSPHAARAQGHSPHAARAHRATIPGLPEFSVISTEDSGGLEVLQTATGHVTGQVSMPAGQIFSYVAGDRSDRTFYVAAQQVDVMATCRAYFYRFSLSAAGQASALTPLPGSGQAGLPTGLAASADGRKLAFSITHCGEGAATKIPPSQAIGYIGLLDTASAKITRHWTYTMGEDYATSVALTPDGNQLTFAQYLPDGSAIVAKTLRTDTPSGTVDQASTAVGLPGVSSLSVGAALYGCISIDKSRGRVANQLGVYGLATGHLTAVLHTWTGFASCTLAPNTVHGNLLVVLETMLGHKQTPFVPRLHVRVLAVDGSTGRLTTLLTTNTYENDTGIHTLIGW